MNEKDKKPRDRKPRTGISIHIGLPVIGLEAFIAGMNMKQSSKSRIEAHLIRTGQPKGVHLSMDEWNEILNNIN